MKTRDWSERTKREGKGILANTYNTCASIWATPIYLWETCVAYLGFDDRLSWCNWIFLSRFFQWYNTCIDQSFSVSPISFSIFLFFSPITWNPCHYFFFSSLSRVNFSLPFLVLAILILICYFDFDLAWSLVYCLTSYYLGYKKGKGCLFLFLHHHFPSSIWICM